MTDPSHRLAAADLAVPADAGAAGVRSVFLKHLAAMEFTPPEQWIASATRMGAAGLLLTRYAMTVLAEYEKVDVEEFLANYWSHPPETRKTHWEGLDGRCRDGEARAALNRVKGGLGVSVVRLLSPPMEDVAKFVREIYLLSPSENALRRMKWCVSMGQTENLKTLGSRFQSAAPSWASLAPGLMQDLHRRKKAPRVVPALDLETLARLEMQSQYVRHTGAGPTLRKALLLVCVLALGLFAAAGIWMANSDGPGRNYRVPNPPAAPLRPTEPTFRSDDETSKIIYKLLMTRKPVKPFTAEQIRQFREYDPKSGQPEPPDYKVWRYIERLDEPPPPTWSTRR